MNKPTATAHFLFPTVVYRNVFENKEKYIVTFKNNIEEYKFDTSDGVITGEYAGKVNVHQNPIFDDFFKELKQNVCDYLDVLGIRSELFDLYVTKSWLSIIEEEKHMNVHAHSESHISFVFYIQVPKNSQALWLFNENRPNEFFEGLMSDPRPSQPEVFLKEINQTNQNSVYFNPEAGMLLLFPSKTPHGVNDSCDAIGPQEGTRIALAGDISLYLKPEYKNFEAGRVAVDFMRKL